MAKCESHQNFGFSLLVFPLQAESVDLCRISLQLNLWCKIWSDLTKRSKSSLKNLSERLKYLPRVKNSKSEKYLTKTELLCQSISKSNYCFKINFVFGHYTSKYGKFCVSKLFLCIRKLCIKKVIAQPVVPFLIHHTGYTFHMYTSLLNPLCIHLKSIKLTDL